MKEMQSSTAASFCFDGKTRYAPSLDFYPFEDLLKIPGL